MRKIFYSPFYYNFIYCVTVVSGYNYSNLFKGERKPQSGKYMNVTTMMKNAHLSYICFFALVLGVFWVFCLMCFHRSSWKSPMTPWLKSSWVISYWVISDWHKLESFSEPVVHWSHLCVVHAHVPASLIIGLLHIFDKNGVDILSLFLHMFKNKIK